MLNLNYNVIGSQRDKTIRGSGIPFQDFLVEVLAIAGGGRGGTDTGGGGGAGGYKYQANYYISSSGFYTVAVGAGQPSWQETGAVCTADPNAGYSISGSNTFVYNSIDGSNFYTMGGGAAACGGTIFSSFPGSNGGSGGGGQTEATAGGSGYVEPSSYRQGYAGAIGGPTPQTAGGGGGGASQEGYTYGVDTFGGAGGNGKLDLTLPTPIYRAGGGTAARANSSSGSIGGGGYYSTSSLHSITDGQPNTGGGGGCGTGGAPADGGRGGSGFVQFKYPGAQRALGGQVYEYKNATGDVLYTVHSFTASGVFQPII